MAKTATQETLNDLANVLGLPYSMVTSTEDTKELRRRLAFARRLQNAHIAPDRDASKITAAKEYLAAIRLHEDQSKILGYVGARLSTVGDYAYDLAQLAPKVAEAAEAQWHKAVDSVNAADMHTPLSKEEKAYLGKVLDSSNWSSKQYAVVSVQTPAAPNSPPLLGQPSRPNVADAWAAALAIGTTMPKGCAGAVLPGPLVDHIEADKVVAIDVTQLDPEQRTSFVYRLGEELLDNPEELSGAVARAFLP